MNRSNLFIAFVSLNVVAFAACGPMKNMESMKETTEKMRDTTGAVKDISANTRDLVGGSMLMGREASKKSRDDAFEDLISKKKTPDFKRKAVAATSLYWAFDFQLYTGISPDTDEVRASFFHPAVEEFFWKTDYLFSHSGAVLDTNNRLAATALGATLHRVNPLQKTHKVKELSMFDLMRDGVEAWIQYKNNRTTVPKVKDYEDLVAKYIPQTHQLLNFRVEGLLNVVAGSFMDLCEPSFLPPQYRVLLRSTFLQGDKVPTIDTYKNNYFELKFAGDALDEAQTTLDLLEKAQLPVEVNSTLFAAMRKVKLDPKRLVGFSIEAEEAQTTFKKLNTVLGRIEKFPQFDVHALPQVQPAKAGAPAGNAKQPLIQQPTRKGSPRGLSAEAESPAEVGIRQLN